MDGNSRSTHWNSGVFTPLLLEFSGSNNTSRVCLDLANDAVITPLFCFQQFRTTNMTRLTVQESNKYALQKIDRDKWKDITQYEFETWLGFLIYMGCVRFSDTYDYRSTSAFYRIEFMQQCSIKRSRWVAIRSSLHFVSNSDNVLRDTTCARWANLHGSNDPYEKVGPLAEMYRY